MPNVTDAQTVIVGNENQITIDIAIGQTASDASFCAGNSFLAMQLDASFTAGNLTFLSSVNGTDFYQLTDLDVDLISLSQASIAAAIAGKNASAKGIQIPLDVSIFSGIQFLKVICSVPQAANQEIKMVMAPVLGS